MYKKIKNSSFMNLIWFIICALPLVLLLIYALGFFNNEDLRANEQDNYTLTLNSISGSTLKTIDNNINTIIGSDNVNNNNILENNILTTNNSFFIRFQYNTSNTNSINFKKIYIFSNDNIDRNYSIVINYQDENNQSQYYYKDNLGQLKNSDKTIYQEFNFEDYYNMLTSEHTVSYLTNIKLSFSGTYNGEKYYIINADQNEYYNYNWFNNYINNVNNFNTINYNSCPISYTYNENTYNIETNNNNYLGTNETLEINQNFNYTLNEEPTLNYNNYFLSNIIENIETILGENIGDNIPITSQYFNQLINCIDIEQWQQTYTYYEFNGDDYDLIEINSQRTYERMQEDLYILQTTTTTYDYEYYNIESAINTSLTLIPNNNFSDFLNNVNNTIQTNGFISSAFLNLSTFFGVNNVYYSLACYYIEYLLVIALLHLAFDVLYMLPNICHKFMEKLGGERD